jgi:tetratricopeptide (TPR) repeat protein
MPVAAAAGFGIIWFFIALSVESSIVPIKNLIFEHRLYLPLAGVSAAAGICAAYARVSFFRRSGAKTVFIAVLAVVLALFGTSTYARNSVWQTEAGLWEDNIRKSPLKPRPYVNLGKAYIELERYDDAIRVLKLALKYKDTYSRGHPTSPDAHFNLGRAYLSNEMPVEGIRQMMAYISYIPDDSDAFFNLGCAYGMLEMNGRAIDSYRKAISLDPANYRARVNLGILYTGIGELGLARMELEAALRFNPNDPQAMMFLRYIKKNIGPSPTLHK